MEHPAIDISINHSISFISFIHSFIHNAHKANALQSKTFTYGSSQASREALRERKRETTTGGENAQGSTQVRAHVHTHPHLPHCTAIVRHKANRPLIRAMDPTASQLSPSTQFRPRPARAPYPDLNLRCPRSSFASLPSVVESFAGALHVYSP